MDLVIRLTPYPTERLTTALHNRYRIERELGQGGNSERHTCGTGLHHFQEMIS